MPPVDVATAFAMEVADRHRRDPDSRPPPSAWTRRNAPEVGVSDLIFGLACNAALRFGLPIAAFEILSGSARLLVERFVKGCVAGGDDDDDEEDEDEPQRRTSCFPSRGVCWSVVLTIEACFAAWVWLFLVPAQRRRVLSTASTADATTTIAIGGDEAMFVVPVDECRGDVRERWRRMLDSVAGCVLPQGGGGGEGCGGGGSQKRGQQEQQQEQEQQQQQPGGEVPAYEGGLDRWLSGWHGGCDPSMVQRGHLADSIAFWMFNRSSSSSSADSSSSAPPPPADSAAAASSNPSRLAWEGGQVEEMLREFEDRFYGGKRMDESSAAPSSTSPSSSSSSSTAAASMPFLHEPISPVAHRPLLLYLVFTGIPRVAVFFVFTLFLGLRRRTCPVTGYRYWHRSAQPQPQPRKQQQPQPQQQQQQQRQYPPSPPPPPPPPLVLFHGLCGFAGYMGLLRLILGKDQEGDGAGAGGGGGGGGRRGAVLFEFDDISMGLAFSRPLLRPRLVQAVQLALERHFPKVVAVVRPGCSTSNPAAASSSPVAAKPPMHEPPMHEPPMHERACVVGHSLGTTMAAWMLLDAPEAVHSVALIDPICFLLEMPDVTFNFLYRQPTLFGRRAPWLLTGGRDQTETTTTTTSTTSEKEGASHWKRESSSSSSSSSRRKRTTVGSSALAWLMDALVSTELGVAVFFRRRFFWYNNLLSPADFLASPSSSSSSNPKPWFWFGGNNKDGPPSGDSSKSNRQRRRRNLAEIPMLVALSENDELSNAPLVLRHVLDISEKVAAEAAAAAAAAAPEGEDKDKSKKQWLSVVWWPGLSHTSFMSFPKCWADIAEWVARQ